MGLIFDSHAHYDDRAFDDDRDFVLSRLPENGVCGITNCGVDIESSQRSIELAEKYPFIYAAVGIHPSEVGSTYDNAFDEIAKLANHKKVVAIGEIGLDYHYDFSDPETQKRVFESQLRLAKELDLPVIVHDREAHQDTLDLLKKYKPKGVVHCFSGSIEMANEIINLGMYIGLGGAVTFKNAQKPLDVAKYVPIDRLLLETDAPYMTPVPFRGKRCDSSHIIYTASKIAELRNMSCDDLLLQTKNNVNSLFSKILS